MWLVSQVPFNAVEFLSTSVPVLIYYNSKNEHQFLLWIVNMWELAYYGENIACEYGLGVALIQKEKLVAYACHLLSETERR